MKTENRMNRKPTYDELEKKILHLEKLLHNESQKAAKLKSIMLSNLHHEIRTPMNAILGYSNLIAQDDQPHAKRKLFLSYIKRGNERLIGFIDDLIDASLLEFGEVNVKEQVCSINRIFDSLYNHFSVLRREEKQNIISLLLNKEIHYQEFYIYCDADRLEKIFFKILQMAFAINGIGVIEFGYTINERFLSFFMNDSRKCFYKYIKSNKISLQQFDEIYTSHINQFNLGLTIAERTIQKMYGKVWVESNTLGGYSIKSEIPIRIPGQNYSLNQNKDIVYHFK